VSGSSLGRLRVVVAGYIVRGPLGGLVWHHLQYVLGLHRLGHDVYFVEDSDDYPSCYDPVRDRMDTDPTYGLRFAADTFASIGLAGCWAYYDSHKGHWHGPAAEHVREICARADLLLNISGVNPLRPWLREIPVRCLVDTDPVFMQIRHLSDPRALEQARQHQVFFSFGENLGTARATVPDDGLPWRATRQPVVLDAWPVRPRPAGGKFTTVMQWDSYPARTYQGVRYGMKSASFEPYLDLPARAGPIFELALGSPTGPAAFLRSKGWGVRDPLEVTRDPWMYQRYLQGSRAEFTVAKHGYVVSRCGWFSERSAAYLASGRPVVTQETGFSDWLPTGEGVLAFATPAAALAGVEAVTGRYEAHCAAARALAEEYFDARKVLPTMLETALQSPPASSPNTPA
jgi:hypothetical protein